MDSPQIFSEVFVEPFRLEWSGKQRVRFFFMGVLSPAICMLTPVILMGPNALRNVLDMVIVFDELWKTMLTFVIASLASLAIIVSSGCLAACCIAPDTTRHQGIRRGLDIGLVVWLLIFIASLGLTMFLIVIPALVVGGLLFAATHWLGNVLDGKYQFSIWRIMKLTFWVALVVFLAKSIPASGWTIESSLYQWLIVISCATPGLASYTFTKIVADVNYVSQS